MYEKIKALESLIEKESEKISLLRNEIHRVLIGQKTMADRVILSLITGGHLLLEGLPGLAKTLCVTTLAKSVDLAFKRIQFTSDLLPADLIGTNVYNPKEGNFTAKKGPIFTQILLADEINRAPAKLQSALLEVMQEKQVTLAEQTYTLDFPFLVLATQNPIEQEGTYPLPEAQLDRFLMKVLIDYPTIEEELEILNLLEKTENQQEVHPILSVEDLKTLQKIYEEVYVDDKIKRYITDLVHATRNPKKYDLHDLTPLIQTGASPRGSISLMQCAKCHAFMNTKGYVTPQDVKEIAKEVLRHRILLTYEAEAKEVNQDAVIEIILSKLHVP